MQKTVIPIGPYHPLQEEPEYFTLTVEGETVVDVDVELDHGEARPWDVVRRNV